MNIDERVCAATAAALLGFTGVASAAPADDLERMGMEAVARADFATAESLFAQAREAGGAQFAMDMDARLGAVYIHADEPGRAVVVLEPYVLADTANGRMISDYLTALRAIGQSKKLVQVFRDHVPDWTQMPVYGLECVAAVYLRANAYTDALKVYEHILTRAQPVEVPYVQLGYAYTLARLGRDDAAVEAYAAVANLAPRYTKIVEGDAAAFVADGRVVLARRLYALLDGDEHAQAEHKLAYATTLVRVDADLENEVLNHRRDQRANPRGHHHEAAKLLRDLVNNDDPRIAHDARLLRAEDALSVGRLADAKRGVDELLAVDNHDAQALTLSGELGRTRRNEVHTEFSSSLDNHRSRRTVLGVDYEGYVGGNLYALAGVEHRWLGDDDDRARLWRSTVGLRRVYTWGEVEGMFVRSDGDQRFNGFQLALTHDFNDVTHLRVEGGRRLVDNAGAVVAGIHENFQAAELEYRLSPRTTVRGGLEWTQMSDDNRYFGFTLGANHLLRIKHNFADRLELTYAQGHYSRSTDMYDSPDRRQEVALNFMREWSLPRHGVTWRWRTALGWGRDDDEPWGFAPSTQVEYVKQFTDDQRLTVGLGLYKYFRQTSTRRNDGFSFTVSYDWSF